MSDEELQYNIRCISAKLKVDVSKLEVIPKSDLVVGETYIGTCRNASKATWNGTEFTYERYKWGSTFEDTINHFEDDDGYDVFVPVKIKE